MLHFLVHIYFCIALLLFFCGHEPPPLSVICREQTFGELNDSHNNKQNELETALQNKNVRQRTTDPSTTSKDQSTRTTKHTNSNTSIRNHSPQTSENVDLTSKTSTVDQSSLTTIKDHHIPAGQDSSQPNTAVQSQSNQEEKEDSRIGSGQTKDENGNGLQKLFSLLNAVADASKQKASTQLSSVNTRESSPELEHPHFLHSSEENTKGHITTPEKQALAVSGQISSPVIPQAACTLRGGAKQITKSLQKLLTKVRPTQLRQTQRYAVHPELAIHSSNLLPRNTFLRRLPCIYMAPYTQFGRNVLNSVPSLFYHSLRPLYVLSDASQYYRKAADNPPSKTTSSSSGTGQAASQGGGQGNSGAQGGGTDTSSGGNGASGSGNGGDDRDKKDRKPRDRKPSSDLEEDVQEVESKEVDEENEVQGDGNTSGNFDSGLGMQVEESPFVEARAEKTEHRAQAHHWCLPEVYKFIGFVTIPRNPTTSTTRPDPMDIPVFQHFHGKVSPSVTQQPPYSPAHSPPTSSRSPSPTHSSDSGIIEPERFDELVTGMQHHNDAEEPSSLVEEETRPPSNLEQVQSTLLPFVAHSSENNSAAVPHDVISAADDEDTDDDEQNDISREPDTGN